MNITNFDEYKILDMADGEKVESWNGIILRRPDPQIIWKDKSNEDLWEEVKGIFDFCTDEI